MATPTIADPGAIFPPAQDQIAWLIPAGRNRMLVPLLARWRSGSRPTSPTEPAMLIVLHDGACLLRDAQRKHWPMRIESAWRGAGRIRLVTCASAGQRLEWRWWQSQMTQPDWRALCRWLLWLERGPLLR